MGFWGPRVNMILSKRYRWFSDDKSHGTEELAKESTLTKSNNYLFNKKTLWILSWETSMKPWTIVGLFESKLAFVRAF